jgi:type I restriction enzyme S subunit
MSSINALIARLCPHGVEFKTVGELGAIYGGLTGKTKADFTSGDARFISYVNVFNNLATSAPPDNRVSVGASERQNAVRFGDVLFTASSERADEVGISSAVTLDSTEPIYLNSFCFGLRPSSAYDLDPEYSKHLFRAASVRRQIVRTANGVTRFNISKERFRAVSVPLPPREIQREIARILNGFTQLEEALTGELHARRTQYAHYRECLFTFLDQRVVPTVPMGEVGTFIRGRRFTKDDVVPTGLSSIHYGEIYTRYGTYAHEAISRVRPELAGNLRFAKTGDVVIASVGETVEDVCKAVAWLGEEDVAIHDDCFAYRHSLDPKYVAYYLQTHAFGAEKFKYVARAKVKRISGDSLAKLGIPVPPVEEQKRIAAILDRFDALVNDASIGLPAELRARRKQYEYYRDRLLSFDQVTA